MDPCPDWLTTSESAADRCGMQCVTCGWLACMRNAVRQSSVDNQHACVIDMCMPLAMFVVISKPGTACMSYQQAWHCLHVLSASICYQQAWHSLHVLCGHSPDKRPLWCAGTFAHASPPIKGHCNPQALLHMHPGEKAGLEGYRGGIMCPQTSDIPAIVANIWPDEPYPGPPWQISATA